MAKSETKPMNTNFVFHMVSDKKTEMYVKFAKVMVICQGPDIDIRENISEKIATTFKSSSRILSDKTYVLESRRPCTAENTENFYAYLREEVKKALETGYNLIYIDATMSNLSQNQYYCSLANKMQYATLILPPVVSQRNINPRFPTGSQADSFRSLNTRIETPNMFQHLFCGWFLHDVDTEELRSECALYIKDLFENIPEFRSWFSKVGPDENFEQYYGLNSKLKEDIAFCTLKIFSSEFHMAEYFSRPQVVDNYGKISKLKIVGFVISPHMVAARVKLTHKQKDLWDMDDIVTEDTNTFLHPSELYRQTKADLPTADVERIYSKSNATLIKDEYIYEPTNLIPPNAKGRTCHIVLGTAPGAPVRNVDYDVAFALNRDYKAFKQNMDIEIFDVGRSKAKRLGRFWFIYLHDTLVVNGLFASFCKPSHFDMPVEFSMKK